MTELTSLPVFSEFDHHAMQRALELAQCAWDAGEVPVGAVIVDAQQHYIAEGYNQTISTPDPTAHAEIIALRQAALQQQNYRLPGATLYVTLEPCVMCMGAILHARLARVVFAAHDPKTGACGSVLALEQPSQLNHQTVVKAGLLADRSTLLLQDFFKSRRAEAKQRKQQRRLHSESSQ